MMHGRIYFVEALGVDRVKIGFTYDVPRRMLELSSENAVELRLIRSVRGSRRMEIALHRRYSEHRTHNEWFTYSPIREDIAAFLATHAARVVAFAEAKLARRLSAREARAIVAELDRSESA